MPDVFRSEYRELSDLEKQLLLDVKNKAQELSDILDALKQSTGDACGRELSLAKTNLEQSVMWAVKAITL